MPASWEAGIFVLYFIQRFDTVLVKDFRNDNTTVQRKNLMYDLINWFTKFYMNINFSKFDFVFLQIVLQEIEIMNLGRTVFAQIMSLIPKY